MIVPSEADARARCPALMGVALLVAIRKDKPNGIIMARALLMELLDFL